MELSGLGTSGDLLRGTADSRVRASEERQAKRLSEMQDALKRLQAMPGGREMAKQSSSNKVGMLKQRLEALKALMLHASPGQARALARELKCIAKELSSVAQSLGGSASPSDVLMPVVAGSPTVGANLAASSSATLLAEKGAVTESDPAGGAERTPNQASSEAEKAGAGNQQAASAGSPESGDQDLRALVQDAKKLLKEVIGMLKTKLAQGAGEAKAAKEAKEANHDLHAAEKSLAEMERALSNGGDALYTAQGALNIGASIESMSVPVAVSGLNVNLTA